MICYTNSVSLLSCIIYLIINIQVIESNKLTKHKRDDNKNKKTLPYVVFITLAKNLCRDDCVPEMCTGTLLHPRFVIVDTFCLFQARSFNATNVRIYSYARPYDVLNTNMSYNTGQRIIPKPGGLLDDFFPTLLDLILMNGTFPEVTYFPKIMYHSPLYEGTSLQCKTSKFSLFDRDIEKPIVEPILPIIYNLEVQFDIKNCSPHDFIYETYYLYLCVGATPPENTLCSSGDIGAPLICKSHLGRPEERSLGHTSRQRAGNQSLAVGRADESGDDEGMYLYGLALRVVPNYECHRNFTSGTDMQLFTYIMPYVTWIKIVLDEFDGRNDYADVDDEVTNDTMLGNMTTAGPNTVFTEKTSTVKLPEYYDINDYINTAKRAIRCKGFVTPDRRLSANYHRSAYIADYNKGPSSVAAAVVGPFARVFLLLLLLFIMSAAADRLGKN